MSQERRRMSGEHISDSEAFVRSFYPRALVQTAGIGYFLHDPESGKALSPFCTGEEPCWRWGRIHIKEFGVLGGDGFDREEIDVPSVRLSDS